MNGHDRPWQTLALALGALVLVLPLSGRAQYGPAGTPSFSPNGAQGTGLGLADATFPFGPFPGSSPPQLPPAGDWAQVIAVTPKWLVLQNEKGQQFPASFEAVQLFAIRWPTTLDRVVPDALVEVDGIDGGAGLALADHVDVYEGAAVQAFGVAPTWRFVAGYNRVSTPYDYQIDQLNTYGETFPGISVFYGPYTGGGMFQSRFYVVGSIAGLVPLRIGSMGNFYTILSSQGGLPHMTTITMGSHGLVRPGDIVYVMPTEARPDTLVLRQLVVHKTMPMGQFAP